MSNRLSTSFVASLCFLSTFIFAVVNSIGGLTFATAADLESAKPLEPIIAEASSEAQESLGVIKIPDGWEINIFAAEPDVANIVTFDVDRRGRIFVCESFRQNRGVTDNRAHDEKWLLADLAAKTVQDRIDYHKRLLGEAAITYSQQDDRIRRLTDSNGDGVSDESQLLANGFNHIEEGTGAGILVRGENIYYTCIPKLWKLVDKDDDGKADDRVVLSNGYGVRVAFRGHDMHGLLIGPDGRLYFSIGDRGYHITTKDGKRFSDPASGAVFRCEMDGSNLEIFATGLRNPQELAFNDVGDLFSVDNNSDSGDQARVVSILRGGDTGWRMFYQYLPDRGPFNQEKIWEPFHEEQPSYIVPPIANFTDGPSGLVYYPGTGFGDQLKNKFLICDFRGGPSNSGIRSFELEPDGAFYQLGKNDQPIWTCLATDVAFGPAGGMYVSDWVDGWDGLGKGRIYRLIDPKHHDSPLVNEVKQLLQGDWTKREAAKLVVDLKHVDRRVRLEAQWELAKRGEVQLLADFAADTDQGRVSRLHAIWGLDQFARTSSDADKSAKAIAAIRPLIGDANEFICAAAVKSLGERGDTSSSAAITKLLSSESARIKYFAAMALGQLKATGALPLVVELLENNDNKDPALRHAGMMYLFQSLKATEVASLKTHKNKSVRRSAVVALRRLESALVSDFLSDKEPLVVAEAARAIHDLPIPVSMPALAALIDSTPTDLVVIRRALNANYRIGDEASAVRIANYAANNAAPTEMRIEALEMLNKWSKPDPRDRVINDFRPIEPRDAKVAMVALDAQVDSLMITDSSVREKMIDVASGLGIKRIAPELAKRIADDTKTAQQRANSLTALARLDAKTAVTLSKKLASDVNADLALAAISVLSRHDVEGSLPTLIKATDHRESRIRQAGWDILAKRKEEDVSKRISQGVQDYIDGKLPGEDHLNLIEAVSGHLDDATTEKLDTFIAQRDAATPLGKWLPALDGGDVDQGARLFFGKTELSCVRCHKVDRAGGEVGPNLTVIGKEKQRKYLLEAICLPNAQIAKGFETIAIVTDEGDVVTGIVKTETDDYVDVLQSDGSLRRVETDIIEGRRKGKSSMPEDLIKQMSMRELRDLVAYLASLKVDPRAQNDVE